MPTFEMQSKTFSGRIILSSYMEIVDSGALGAILAAWLRNYQYKHYGLKELLRLE
jgi:hypothetical protein